MEEAAKHSSNAMNDDILSIISRHNPAKKTKAIIRKPERRRWEMGFIYEDEYLPLERNLKNKQRNKQGGQKEQGKQEHRNNNRNGGA
jgi:hypothetical protein